MPPLAQELRQAYLLLPPFLQKMPRVTLAVCAAVFAIVLWGSVLGAISGYLFSLLLQHPLLDQRAWFEGRANQVAAGSVYGQFYGMLLGLFGFGLALWRNPELLGLQPFIALCRNIVKCSVIGIAFCVVNLVPIGALFACYLADNNIELDTYLWFQSAWFAPASMIAAEGALNGFLWGITLGFCGGTIFALYQSSQKPGINLPTKTEKLSHS